MTDTRAFRAAAAAATPAARGAQPAMTRAQAAAGGLFVNRAAKPDTKPAKPAADDDDDMDGKNPKKGGKKGDDESLFEKGLDSGDMVSKQSAGSAGDFTPMKGSLDDPFDSNADKGDNPAPNSTGVPKTPSGA